MLSTLTLKFSNHRWPIEIDGLPFLTMVIFHGELFNNQMVLGEHIWPEKRVIPWIPSFSTSEPYLNSHSTHVLF